MLEPITAPGLAGLPNISHGFFGRRGGASQGIYTSLNCGLGSQDDPAAVRENRGRIARHLGGAAAVLTPHQIHSDTTIVVDRPWVEGERPKADAIVTATPGIAVGVLAADCGPVLLADPVARVVGAAHAGWRGAIGGVVESAIASMETLGARRDRMRAAIGPCISQASYEVGPEFEAEFLARDPESPRFFMRRTPESRPHFDLPGYLVDRLRRAGIAAVNCCASCTYVHADDFFSFRRTKRLGEIDYGRQISAIVLT